MTVLYLELVVWAATFIGAVGTLMKNRSLFLGKIFLVNLRELHFAMLEPIWYHICPLKYLEDLMKFFDKYFLRRMCYKHWIENIIWPVFLMLLYTPAKHDRKFIAAVFLSS